MPVLLGLPVLFRILIGFVPLALGYIAKFFSRLVTRGGIIAFVFVAMISATVGLLTEHLSSVIGGVMPPDFSNLISSILPDHFQKCVNTLMITRISIFVFDLKERFISIANKVI
ncbi:MULTISPECIES: DUF5455 family protein [Pectobacterium]|uniref:DUF5455 family protein n=1 Tax=Pectobacterium TaxID=122277 RepID=UPI000CE68FB3|nr:MULTISPECIES: DUF5455 family protein [Pectobacterium]MBN3182565.1 DUF5455 family protein [Pectobacterium brasiliense]MDY4367994.1 DUF5455 family protein [Pectobacterium brasiliense]MDY7057370.1 DUF5455 family protein [Pectobacterium brasiliense]PPE64797.1 hypothetical protein F152LOC_00263 [Pectobacterium brasiliense]